MSKLKKQGIFDGARNPREKIERIYQPDQLIKHTLKQDRPCLIFPDGHIFLETFSPFYERVVDFIIAIADPCSRPAHMHEFQLNEYSIFSSITLGISCEEIISTMELISKNEITEELKTNIRECAKKVDRARILLKNERYFIESKDLETLYEIFKEFKSNEKIRQYFVNSKRTDDSKSLITYRDCQFIKVQKDEVREINEHLMDSGLGTAYNVISMVGGDTNREQSESSDLFRFEVGGEAILEVRRVSVEKNFFLSDEYDLANDNELRELDIKLLKSDMIRDYQSKAITKLFLGSRVKSGIIVLPCGAGKTLVGISAVTRLAKSAIVLCNSVEPVKQWAKQFTDWTTVDPKKIIKLTKDEKKKLPADSKEPCIVITTYGMIVANTQRSEEGRKILEQITSRTWGMMVLDEVQGAAAREFRRVVEKIRAKSRLGLTATLVREDGEIDSLKHIVGPKLYEADWQQLSQEGYLARVKCFEVLCKMPERFVKEYNNCGDSGIKRMLAATNPTKINIAWSLLKYHERRDDKTLVFVEHIALLNYLKKKFKLYAVYGDVSDERRTEIFNKFRTGEIKSLIISKVGNRAIDLPDANVLIQISSTGGREVEAQRLGRILRPKPGRKNEEYNAYFYSLVSQDTYENFYSRKRLRFLVDQGYSFEPIDDAETRYIEFIRNNKNIRINPEERWKVDSDIPFKTDKDILERLEEAKRCRDDGQSD